MGRSLSPQAPTELSNRGVWMWYSPSTHSNRACSDAVRLWGDAEGVFPGSSHPKEASITPQRQLRSRLVRLMGRAFRRREQAGLCPSAFFRPRCSGEGHRLDAGGPPPVQTGRRIHLPGRNQRPQASFTESSFSMSVRAFLPRTRDAATVVSECAANAMAAPRSPYRWTSRAIVPAFTASARLCMISA